MYLNTLDNGYQSIIDYVDEYLFTCFMTLLHTLYPYYIYILTLFDISLVLGESVP